MPSSLLTPPTHQREVLPDGSVQLTTDRAWFRVYLDVNAFEEAISRAAPAFTGLPTDN